jgi:hypothetical protein
MQTPAPVVTADVARSRLIAFNVTAGLIGFVSGAFGLLSIVSALGVERTVHRLHDIGSGLVLAVLMAPAAFALVGAHRRSIAGMQQAAAVVIAATAGTVLSHTVNPFVGTLLVFTVLLAALHPARERLLAVPGRPSWTMGAIAGGAAVALIPYAVNQAALQRWTVPSNPHAAEAHYGGMASMALALALVALVAALQTDGWRLPAWCAGLAAATFGIASMVTPHLEGSFGTAGGVSAVVAGTAFIAAAELQARRESRGQHVPGTSERALDQVV